VPRGSIAEAAAWVAERHELLAFTAIRTSRRARRSYAPTRRRRAAALYFLDAGGNVVELIANDHLDTDSDAPFGPDSLLEIAEIGLATGDIETCCYFPRCRTASAAPPTCKPPRGPQQAREVLVT
jgi:hypothetical protein